jgi:hypothetical protein
MSNAKALFAVAMLYSSTESAFIPESLSVSVLELVLSMQPIHEKNRHINSTMSNFK